MDEIDRRIINDLQEDFPISERPYKDAAESLGLAESDLISRLERLCGDGTLNRFGPLFNAERFGGAVTLAAIRVPEDRFEEVAEQVNRRPEISQNYARDDDLNMWFVIATETPGRIAKVIAEIEHETGLEVIDLPKIEEFYIGLRFQA
ncbi:MAG: Lrp/AsnC family transcriptional regulator [Rhodospirillales bacterium]|nr:Lrp/AsnC family transcriptional regulator [Rhodospirillales bacterium]